MGDVIGDLNRRRGLIEGMEDGPSGKIVRALCRWPKCSVTPLPCVPLPRVALPTRHGIRQAITMPRPTSPRP